MDIQPTFEKENKVIEPHLLDLHFSHVRMHRSHTLSELMTSIEQHSQLVAAIVVPTDEKRFVLIDGYLRLKAIQRLGQDTLKVEVWQTEPLQALFSLFASQQSAKLEVIEEAMLLREIQSRYSCSQETLAHRIGRSASWISYRLSLINDLPENVLKAVYQGKLSTWAASRLFAPFARANSQHAEQFLNYLLKHYHSTREQQHFFEHYQTSNTQVRENMVAAPDLFFKSQEMTSKTKQAKQLRPAWKNPQICRVIFEQLESLVIYCQNVSSKASPVAQQRARYQLPHYYS